SPAAAQSGVVTVYPTSNTTPDPGQAGTSAVTGNTNTGHGSTTSTASRSTTLITRTCAWAGFVAVSGQIQSAILKADWTQDGTLSDGGIQAQNDFSIEYSVNGGSSWTTLRDALNIQSPSSGSSQATLSNVQDLTQVKVRDSLTASHSGT